MREDLNRRAPRVMAVLNPVKVVITNYPEGQVEEVDVINNPEDESAGTRKVPFSRELYIERDDFREDPPKKYFRLSPGAEVRLRYAYIVKCTGVTKDPATGEERWRDSTGAASVFTAADGLTPGAGRARTPWRLRTSSAKSSGTPSES